MTSDTPEGTRSMRVETAAGTFITRRGAARLLGCHDRTLDKIARAAGVRQRHMPGLRWTWYSLEDLERLMAESIAPAGRSSPALQAQKTAARR